MDLLEITSVPVIVGLVFLVMYLYKHLAAGKEKLIRLIPIFAAALGAVLGIIAFYAIPEIIAAENIFSAILIGAASGLAATGTHQIFKQLTKEETKTEDKEDEIKTES